MDRLSLRHKDADGHINVLQCGIPENINEVEAVVKGIADSLVNGCKRGHMNLAQVAYGFVHEDGVVPVLCEKIAENMEAPENKIGLAFICSLGKELFLMELGLLKDQLAAEGLERPTGEWLIEHQKECTFTWTVHQMAELTCDCPACIMFWSAKRFSEQMPTQAMVDELITVINTESERGNDGCVKHNIPDAGAGKWLSLDE